MITGKKERKSLRNGKEKDMYKGKHEVKEDATVITTITDPEGFYKERIKKLEADVARLTKEKEEMELNLAVMTNMYEQSAETIERYKAWNKDMQKRKNTEITKCKEAIFLAAMREVELR